MRIIQSENPRPLNLLAVGPNGLVAAASGTFGVPGNVEVWDATRGVRQLFHEAPEHNAARSVLFTPDGRYLFAGEPELKIALIDLTSHAVVTRVQTNLGRPGFALSADATRLIVTSSWNQSGAVECFAVEAGPTFRQLWIDGPPDEFLWFDEAAITPDGKRAAVTERSAFGGSGGRPALHVSIRDVETGKLLVAITTDAASPIQQLAFTVDGSKLLARTDSRTVQLFDATTGAPAGELVHTGRPYVTGIAVHPRGPVACARTNGTVTFWDAEKREQLRTLDWKVGKLVSVAFSPDGALGAAGTEDGKLVVWDVDV